MTVRQAIDGVAKTKTQVTAAFATTTVTLYTVDQDYIKDFRLEGQTAFQGGRQLLWKAGQVIQQADIDAAFPAGSITSITPATGLAAGGLVTTIKGTNFSGATAAAFGGTAGTAFSVVDDNTIKVTTPAHTAATVNVTVTDDSGTLTLTNGFIYT